MTDHPKPLPSKESMEKAAQLWCLPQHSHKEMDADFAVSIARLLDCTPSPAREDLAKADPERIAVIQAHRACHGAEHDPLNGKLHGYCVVCGVPFPCEYVGKPPPPSKSEAENK